MPRLLSIVISYLRSALGYLLAMAVGGLFVIAIEVTCGVSLASLCPPGGDPGIPGVDTTSG